MDIFISHSNQDVTIVKAIIELIRSALNVPASKIRCTSVAGYKLTAGASTDAQIRKEVFESKVLLGVISPNSMQSVYVMFELGARWSIDKPMIPLATNHLSIEQLKAPLKGINTLDSSVRADVFQLITDLGTYLEISPEAPSVYEHNVDEVVRLSLEDILPPSIDINDTSKENTNIGDAVQISNADNGYTDAELIIKQYCIREWPGDYAMQAHCMKQQRDSVKELKKGKPTDIPAEVFEQIRSKAALDWPDDYLMRAHAEKTQIDSYRELNN